jgi:hypothetical protein
MAAAGARDASAGDRGAHARRSARSSRATGAGSIRPSWATFCVRPRKAIIAYFELAEEMEEKDLHYLSVLGTRKRAVSQLPIEVEPAGEDDVYKQDAQLVRDWLDRDLLESELFDVLDAVAGREHDRNHLADDGGRMAASGDQVAASAVVRVRPDGWRNAVAARRPGCLARHARCRRPSSSPCASGQERPADPQRFGRIAAWGYMFKNFAIKDWVTFLRPMATRSGSASTACTKRGKQASWSGRSTAWARTRGGFP